MKKEFKIYLRILVFISIILILISLLSSLNIVCWDVSVFFNSFEIPFLIINVLTIFFLSYYAYKSNLLIEKPTLVFVLNEDYGFYKVKNIGKGAALNIIVKYKSSYDSQWSQGIKLYSLGNNDEISLDMLDSVHELKVYYDDILGNHHYTTMKDDFLKYGTISDKKYKILISGNMYRVWHYENPPSV